MKKLVSLLSVVLVLGVVAARCKPTATPTPTPEPKVKTLKFRPVSTPVAVGAKTEVKVTAFDSKDRRVSGATIEIVKLMGLDIRETFGAREDKKEKGTYGAWITSACAGPATLVAIDKIDKKTGVTDKTTLNFEPGPAHTVTLDFTNPRDEEPRDTANVVARVLDDKGNVVRPGKIPTIGTTLGEVTLKKELEGPAFVYAVQSRESGIAKVSVTASGVKNSVDITFPVIYAALPNEPTLVGETFEVPISVFVNREVLPQSSYTLSYTLTISFTPEDIEFVDAVDGDTKDDLPEPEVKTERGKVTIHQTGPRTESMTDVARLKFKGLSEGKTELSLVKPSAIDVNGKPVRYEQSVDTPLVTLIVKKDRVYLRIFREEKCTVTDEEIRQDIKEAQRIFDACYPDCFAICIQPDEDRKEFRELSKVGQLDDHIVMGSLTGEEGQLLDSTRRDLGGKWINVYYLCQDPKNSPGSAIVPRDFPTDFDENGDFDKYDASIMLGPGARDYTGRKALAHLMAHVLGELDDQPCDATGNLMGGGWGTELSAKQCDDITKNGIQNGYLGPHGSIENVHVREEEIFVRTQDWDWLYNQEKKEWDRKDPGSIDENDWAGVGVLDWDKDKGWIDDQGELREEPELPDVKDIQGGRMVGDKAVIWTKDTVYTCDQGEDKWRDIGPYVPIDKVDMTADEEILVWIGDKAWVYDEGKKKWHSKEEPNIDNSWAGHKRLIYTHDDLVFILERHEDRDEVDPKKVLVWTALKAKAIVYDQEPGMPGISPELSLDKPILGADVSEEKALVWTEEEAWVCEHACGEWECDTLYEESIENGWEGWKILVWNDHEPSVDIQELGEWDVSSDRVLAWRYDQAWVFDPQKDGWCPVNTDKPILGADVSEEKALVWTEDKAWAYDQEHEDKARGYAQECGTSAVVNPDERVLGGRVVGHTAVVWTKDVAWVYDQERKEWRGVDPYVPIENADVSGDKILVWNKDTAWVYDQKSGDWLGKDLPKDIRGGRVVGDKVLVWTQEVVHTYDQEQNEWREISPSDAFENVEVSEKLILVWNNDKAWAWVYDQEFGGSLDIYPPSDIRGGRVVGNNVAVWTEEAAYIYDQVDNRWRVP